MKNIYKIINEEVIKYLREREEDIDWDLQEMFDDIKRDTLTGFLNDKKHGIKQQPWELVPFARLKKIWEDYMRTGVVRDTRGLEMIEDIIQRNIIKLYVNTQLVGHADFYQPEYDFEEYNFSKKDIENFYNYISRFSDYAFSDFGGRRLGLTTLLTHLRKATTPEEKVVIIDQILNVIHQTSDLAADFVEGGSHALSQLSGSPSEVQA
jgi:hypothetical protein